MEITIKPAYEELETIQKLLEEYTAAITEQAPEYADYLKLQGFQDELVCPEEKYGHPGGRLYLVLADGQPAGCIGMHRLDETLCAMKRLYIRPAFRGQGIARRLVERLLADARKVGYEAMLLDTFPFLDHAIRLYKELGFYEIESYNNSPMDMTIFMRKDLLAK